MREARAEVTRVRESCDERIAAEKAALKETKRTDPDRWGLGFRGYISDAFNVFDGIIVHFSIVELAIEFSTPAGEDVSTTGLSALRTFRLARSFKLAKSWDALRILLGKIMQSLVDVSNAAILLLLIVFIFSLLGMQLFGGLFGPRNFASPPRAHFDSVWWSIVTVFQVLTGESWSEAVARPLLFGLHEPGNPLLVGLFFVSFFWYRPNERDLRETVLLEVF